MDKNENYGNSNQISQGTRKNPDSAVSYVTGAIGAFLGALLGVLPTLIVGLFGFVSGYLGILTAFASMKGYQLFKGPRRNGYAFGVIMFFSVVLTGIVSVILFMPYGFIYGDTHLLLFFMLPVAFSVIGALICRRSLKTYTQPELLQYAMEYAEQINAGEEAKRTELYYSEKGWMWPLRISMILLMFPGLLLMIGLLIIGFQTHYAFSWILASLGACIGAFASIFASFPLMGLVQTDAWIFVRWEDGTLWRIQFNLLNHIDTYRFTAKSVSFRALTWRRLDPAEQEMARASILRAVSELRSGKLFPGSMLSQAVVPLTDLQVKKETKWSWKVLYRTDAGTWKKAVISKAYKGLAPAPGINPPQGPVPYRWGLCIIMWACTLLFAAAGGCYGYMLDGGFKKPVKAASANMPGKTQEYEIDGVLFEVDSVFREKGPGVFFDSRRNAEFAISVRRDADKEEAVDALLLPIGTARFDKSFDSFRFEYQKDDLGELAGADGEIFQYNILSVYFGEERTIHMAVGLWNDGTLVVIAAEHDRKKDERKVKGDILFILENAEV